VRRNPQPEIRRPKESRRPRSKGREPCQEQVGRGSRRAGPRLLVPWSSAARREPRPTQKPCLKRTHAHRAAREFTSRSVSLSRSRMLCKMAAILPDREGRKMAGTNPSRLIFLPAIFLPAIWFWPPGSDFGTRNSDLLRISDFEFRIFTRPPQLTLSRIETARDFSRLCRHAGFFQRAH
jgi:hypothetical protein